MSIRSTAAVSELFSDIDFPATRDDLLLAARRSGADTSLMSELDSLPSASFNGRWEVRRAMDSHVLVA